MNRLILSLFLVLITGVSFGQSAIQSYKLKVDSTITNKTQKGSIQPSDVGGRLKDLANIVDTLSLGTDGSFIGTLEQMRNLTGPAYKSYQTTDPGKEGIWVYDADDSTSSDNTGTILITGDDKRLKRVIQGPCELSWFIAPGNVSSGDIAVAIEATVNAGSAVLNLQPNATYNLDTTLNMGYPITIMGNNSILRMDTLAAPMVAVFVDSVVFNGVSFSGRATRYKLNNTAILSSLDSVAFPIRGLTVVNCKFNNWGYAGIYTKYNTGMKVQGSSFDSIAYAGILAFSTNQSDVSNNTFTNITGASTPSSNAYGVTFSRSSVGDTTQNPLSRNNTVTGNKFKKIPTWTGVDTHGGQDMVVSGNTFDQCYWPIGIGGTDNLLGDAIAAPKNIVVTGNTMKWNGARGKARFGVSFTGAQGILGAPVEYATGVISNNTIDGYGDEANSLSGAIYMRDTKGLVVEGNTISNSSPYGINVYHDNSGFKITGNAFLGANSDSISTPGAIIMRDKYNKDGIVENNTMDTGTVTALFNNTRGLQASTPDSNSVYSNWNDFKGASAPYAGIIPINKFRFPFAAKFDLQALGYNGSESNPSFSFENDANTGFYSPGNDINRIGVVTDGTRRALFRNDAFVLEEGYNVSIGTGTGSIIGLGAGAKIGFWGAAPIAQPTLTGTYYPFPALTTLITTLESEGLIKNSAIQDSDITVRNLTVTGTSTNTSDTAYLNANYWKVGGNNLSATGVFGSNTNNALQFRTNATTRLTLTGAGNATFTGFITASASTYASGGYTYLVRNSGTGAFESRATVPTADVSGLDTAKLRVAISSVKTSNYTTTLTDCVVPVDATSGNITIQLQTGGVPAGRIYYIKKVSATNDVVLDPEGGATIDGALTFTISTLNQTVQVVFDGSGWLIL